jgi:hypothetical protein
MIKISDYFHWRRLRVLPDEYALNLKAIEKIAIQNNALFIAVNPIYTNFEKIFIRPQDLLISLGMVQFMSGKDREIIQALTPRDYVREDGVFLKECLNFSPQDLFLDYWHPNVRGHEVIAGIIMRELASNN